MTMITDASTLSVTWWKSSRSGTQGDCVECGVVDAGERVVAVRDSKRPCGPALVLSYEALGGLVGALRAGGLK
ncbi:DUF397 domain-containing protein [Streptomyces sp. NPDC049954]|uniref:DUF397 domain-containing protein n=1 Tax=Streptomyces sp. NPDC049954 TaxID=3155779 RepID=UPI00341DA1FA